MPDHHTPDELSLAELEALVEQRRRIERARRVARQTERPGFGLASLLSGTVKTKSPATNRRRRLPQRALLLVEMGMALALALVMIAYLTNLELLNRAASQPQTATPSANAVWAAAELPASPFPPTHPLKELPGSSFPPEPAPPALGIRLQSLAPLPVPTSGPRAPTRIVIPACYPHHLHALPRGHDAADCHRRIGAVRVRVENRCSLRTKAVVRPQINLAALAGRGDKRAKKLSDQRRDCDRARYIVRCAD